MKKFLIALAASSMLVPTGAYVLQASPAKSGTKPQYGSYGFDMAGMDR